MTDEIEMLNKTITRLNRQLVGRTADNRELITENAALHHRTAELTWFLRRLVDEGRITEAEWEAALSPPSGVTT